MVVWLIIFNGILVFVLLKKWVYLICYLSFSAIFGHVHPRNGFLGLLFLLSHRKHRLQKTEDWREYSERSHWMVIIDIFLHLKVHYNVLNSVRSGMPIRGGNAFSYPKNIICFQISSVFVFIPTNLVNAGQWY